MKQNKRTSKGSNDKIPIFTVGDIVRIVPNHKPYSRGITRKYPHGKELINHICFVEQVLGDKCSLYAIGKIGIDKKIKNWYIGDILESCLERQAFFGLIHLSEDDFSFIRKYKHFIYPDDMDNMINRMKENEKNEQLRLSLDKVMENI